MAEPRPENVAVLGYEQNPEPPCVVRSPGRVALLMPAPPRWVVAACAVVIAAVWVLSIFVAVRVGVAVSMLGLPPHRVVPVVVFYLASPLVTTALLAGIIRWWVRASRIGAVLEVTGGEVIYTNPGMWRTRIRRWPVADVKDVTLDVAGSPAFGSRSLVRVKVVLAGWRPKIERGFYTTDMAVVTDAKAAFAAALAKRPSDEIR